MDTTDQNNKKLQIVKSTLSNKLAIGGPAETLKYLRGLSAENVHKARRLRSDLEFEIDKLQRWLVTATKSKVNIQKKLDEVQAELEKTPHFPTIAELRTNEQQLHEDLQLLIIQLSEFYNVGKEINGDQIVQLSILISESMPSLTLEDVALCFRAAQTGVYGQIYDRLDGGVIMGWLRKYEKERREMIHEMNQRQHVSQKAGAQSMPHLSPGNTEYKNFLKQFRFDSEMARQKNSRDDKKG